jgi:orotate phosphoribosyltransferase
MTVDNERTRLLNLLKKDALLRGDFTLSSGKKSTYYINAKKVIMKAEGSYLAAKVMLRMLPPQTEAVGGLTMGADPLVCSMTALSYLEKKPIEGFLIRKEPKGHGTNQYIEGDVAKGAKVVIVEDVITTGASVLKAVKIAQDYGLKVLKVFTLLDREEEGTEMIRSQGFDVEPVFRIGEVLS